MKKIKIDFKKITFFTGVVIVAYLIIVLGFFLFGEYRYWDASAKCNELNYQMVDEYVVDEGNPFLFEVDKLDRIKCQGPIDYWTWEK